MDWWWNLLAALEGHPGQAAWAQAVFSAAAIFAAIALAVQSSRQAREVQKAEVVRRIELVCSLGWQVQQFVRTVMQRDVADPQAPMPTNLEMMVVLIDRYPLEQLPSGEVALRMANIRRLADGFFRAHSRWVDVRFNDPGKIPADGPGREILARLAESLESEYDMLLTCAQALLDALPGRRVVLGMDAAV